MKKNVLIIGAGMAGCAAAHQFELLGDYNTTIVDSAGVIGAGVRTDWYGGHPYTFGPRYFLTQNQKVFDYFNDIVPLRIWDEHEYLTYVEKDQKFYTYPIHMGDIRHMPDAENILVELSNRLNQDLSNANNFEEYWSKAVGPSLYSKFIDGYNKKMWQVESNKEIDFFSWSPKGVDFDSGSRGAWNSAIYAYPYAYNGYNDYFDFSTKKSNVILNEKIKMLDVNNKKFLIKGEEMHFDIVVNTISPDLLFGQDDGVLNYIGRNIEKIIFPSEFILPKNIFFLYYAGSEKYTRIVEYKKLTKHKSNTTLIGIEYPSNNGRHYPVPTKKGYNLAQKYISRMPDNFYSMGRAGSFLYAIDMDDCIEQALNLRKIISNGGSKGVVDCNAISKFSPIN